MYTACIDPGLGGTGVAVFRDLDRKWKKPRKPRLAWELQHMPKLWYRQNAGNFQEKWLAKVAWLSDQLRLTIMNYNLTSAYLELPELWSGSAKSQSAAVQGDLFKLTYLIGNYAQVLRWTWAVEPRLLRPREWKGQMSKSVIARRVYRSIERRYESEHILEAVGIGLSLQGVL